MSRLDGPTRTPGWVQALLRRFAMTAVKPAASMIIGAGSGAGAGPWEDPPPPSPQMIPPAIGRKPRPFDPPPPPPPPANGWAAAGAADPVKDVSDGVNA